MELSKNYEPKEVEDKIYQFWQESGFLNPDNLPPLKSGQAGQRKKSYTIVIPPPNVTGSLHMGHALNAVIQDILIRKKRMEGYRTLWIPGTDHAGIATQNVVEKELKKEGLTRFDLGKEKFIERIWQWRDQYGNIILEQLKKLGASCDWSRTRFTMDQDYVKAVEAAFSYYHKKGWIYQGERVISWCPRCQTSLSDLEIEYKEELGKLWYIRYPLKGGGHIIVATTRPETMLGDTAVAVNPRDKRYKDLIGKIAILPIQKREIPIIADRIINQKFGTGAVKVTPAHDLNDWEIKERHQLEVIKIINERGLMTKESKICEGLKISECREIVIKELEKENLIEKIEDYIHSLPRCYRCNVILEPLPSLQWFLKMGELAKTAITAVKSGKVKFHPKKWEKIYFDWLKNIKDWCISRQIWWGHKIPIEGVTDVLDTWFSSALWPFATLGWPNKTIDLKNFYPTNVLSTDRGIINLWVTRMIFSGLEFMKKPPFENIYIHATVLTKEGRRMSKSLGTGIDPLLLIDKYGADAVRFGIAWQIMGGQDIKFVEDNIVMGRKFCNKLWNASRFVAMQISGDLISRNYRNVRKSDLLIIRKLNKTIKSVNQDLESFQFGKAARRIYSFFWHDFCDIYIEKTKKQDNKKTKETLLYVLLNSLKLLHPFVPFITEEIYTNLLPKWTGKKILIIESWPPAK
jgi:valyl-tRNA synthetase